MFVGRISQFQKNSHRKSYIILQIYIGVPWIIILERGVGWGQNKSWCVKDSIFNMNQVKKIGTIRLSTFFFFCFTQTILTHIFLTFLNIPARKLFYANISQAFGPLAYTPAVTPMGLFVNYPSFWPDLDEPCTFSTNFRKMFQFQISWISFQGGRVVPCG